MTDLRLTKDVAKEITAQINKEDENWNWKVKVLKNEIRLYWGYLEYIGGSYFSIKVKEVPCDDETFVCLNAYEHDEKYNDEYTMVSLMVGTEFWCDGTLEQCVVKAIKGIARKAHNEY